MPESRIHAAGFVLAGGQSSRMGTDKALVELDGEPLIARALRTMRAVCPAVMIAGGVPALARFGPVVADRRPFQGPLGGIVAALEASAEEWSLFMPVDTPFLPEAALDRLLRAAHGPADVAILARPADHTNPLVALYRRSALPVMAAELAAGRLRVRGAVEAAGTVSYADFAAAGEQGWFRNVNTPADLEEVRSSETPGGR